MRLICIGLLAVSLAAQISGPMFPGPGTKGYAGGGGVTITYVQGRAGGNDAVTSVAAASASPDYSIGNAIIVRVGYRDGCSTATISVSDDGTAGGNTYTQIGSSVDNAGVTCQALFRSFATKTADTVTASFTASVRFPSISVLEFNGPTAVDQNTSGTDTNSTAVTGSVTTTQNDEAFVLGVQTHGGDFSTNQPTGPSCGTWTKVATDPFGGMGGAWYCIASSTYSGTFSVLVDSATIVTANVGTFK